MDLSKQIFQLANVMKTTHEYRNLLTAMDTLRKKPEVEALLHNLKEKEKMIYQSSNPDAAMKHLNEEYKKLENYPEIKGYFQAAEQFNQLLGQINDTLIKHLQITS